MKGKTLPKTPQKKRVVLTLGDKVKVIQEAEKNPTVTKVALAEKFGVGRTQIANIIKEKDTIMKAYGEGAKSTSKYLQPRHELYPKLNEKIWDFYCEARSKQIPVSGVMLKHEATIVAEQLGLENFMASNGWLRSFASRYQLNMSKLHGESAAVDPVVCDQWKDNLASVLRWL